MISYLTGKIIDLDFTNAAILTSSGVGYEVGINELTYSKLEINSEVNLYVYHHITEGHQSLFAFIEKSEKDIFKELIKISGVGGKVAMLILGLGVERLVSAVKSEDNKTIESVKGIGKKMAEKIVIELKDKDFGVNIIEEKLESVKTSKIGKDLHESIKNTLTNMGYNPRDIDRVLSKLPEGMEDAGQILPYVIKELS